QFLVRLMRHLLEAGRFVAQPPDLARRLGDRLDLGIVPGELHERLRIEVARRHGPRQFLLARLDGGNAFGGDPDHEIDFTTGLTIALTRRMSSSGAPSPDWPS